MRRLLLGILTASTLSAQATAADPDPDVGAYLAARTASINSDFDAAVRYFARALAHDPSNKALMEGLLISQAATGEWTRAVPVARRLLEIEPDNPVGNLVLLVDAEARDDYDAVLRRIADGKGIGGFPDALLSAWAEFGKGNVTAALGTFDKAAEDPTAAPLALTHKAYALASAGDFEAAERILSGAAGQRFQLGERATIARIEILAQLERADDALALAKRALETRSSPVVRDLARRIEAGETPAYDLVNGPREGAAEVFYTVAAAVSGETTNTNALVYARAALHLRPGHADAALLAADLLEAEGQHDLADAVYSTVPVDHPAYPEAAIGRAEVLMALGKNDEAIGLLKSLVASRPQDPDILSALATAYRRLERWAEAEETYSRAIEAKPAIEARDWALFYARAIARERQGKWEAAEADFRKALELNPDQPSVLNYLGYSLIERGEKLEEALDLIRRAVKARPDDGYILDSLAWAYFKLGRYEEAVEPMERATELLPSDPILNDHLGDIYWMVGRKREARFQWRRALSFGPEPDEARRISRKLEVGLDRVLAEEANGG